MRSPMNRAMGGAVSPVAICTWLARDTGLSKLGRTPGGGRMAGMFDRKEVITARGARWLRQVTRNELWRLGRQQSGCGYGVYE